MNADPNIFGAISVAVRHAADQIAKEKQKEKKIKDDLVEAAKHARDYLQKRLTMDKNPEGLMDRLDFAIAQATKNSKENTDVN